MKGEPVSYFINTKLIACYQEKIRLIDERVKELETEKMHIYKHIEKLEAENEAEHKEY